MESKPHSYTDEELLVLVKQWQGEPDKYLNLLVEQVYKTLYTLCKREVTSSTWVKRNIEVTASSLVHDAYFKISMSSCETEFETLRQFYEHLRTIVRAILIDRARQKNALKRNSYVSDVLGFDFSDREQCEVKGQNLEVFDQCLEKLKAVDAEAAEAISFRVYDAKTLKQIAFIMDRSIATVERLFKHGVEILHAIFRGVEIAL